MKNKKLINSAIALSAVALIGLGIISAQAAENNPFNRKGSGEINRAGQGFENLSESEQASRLADMEARRTQMEEHQAAAEAAIAANDYTAWQAAVGPNNPFAEKVTAENFAQFIEAHNLMNQAREIFKEMGIDNTGGMGHRGQGMGQRFGGMIK